VIFIRCGQDYEAKNFEGTVIIQINCPLLSDADSTLTAYKDGVEIDGFTGTLRFGPIPRPTDNVFGTYAFLAENICGRDIALTRIIRKGQCNCWCMHAY